MKDVLDALKKAIEEGQAKDAAKAVQAALDGGAEPGAILRDVMVPAMDEVGRRYECGDYFLPEMLISARAMKEALAVLRPRLVATDVKPVLCMNVANQPLCAATVGWETEAARVNNNAADFASSTVTFPLDLSSAAPVNAARNRFQAQLFPGRLYDPVATMAEPGEFISNTVDATARFNNTQFYASFSRLDQINKSNVKNFRVAFTWAMGGTQGGGKEIITFPFSGLEGTPVAEDGFLYLTTGWGEVTKLDTRGGIPRMVWKYDPRPVRVYATTVACCGINIRGAVLAGSMVITPDNDAAETALFSLSKWQLRQLAELDTRLGSLLTRLLAEPQDVLATMVLGNTFAGAAMLAVGLWMALRQEWPLAITVMALLLLVLLGGEVLPKTLAVRKAESWALRVARPLALLHRLARRLHQFAQRLNRALLGVVVPQSVKPHPTFTDAEYRELVELAFQQGTLPQSARDIILQIIHLDRRTAKDVLRPRSRMAAIPDDSSIEDMIAAAGPDATRTRPLPMPADVRSRQTFWGASLRLTATSIV